jgi:predicted AAA+ superfamily ATPase
VVVLTGPRQSGKTTELKHGFGARHAYVSLEPPDVRAAAEVDPRGFLARHPPPVILDEIQYAPGLLPYIKELVDAKRSRPGQFLLTGSQNLSMSAAVTESLAGRAAVLRLLPLSWREIAREPGRMLPWERARAAARAGVGSGRLWPAFVRGSYPELVARPRRDFTLWHSSYVQTYLERDVRSLRQVGDLVEFQRFLRAVAARSAQLLDLSDIARDLGVAVNTAKAWLSVLEATYQVFLLRPYYANLGKRLVKTPKLYFLDVGLAAHLIGIEEPGQVATHPLRGALFETLVFGEFLKDRFNRGLPADLYFWRDNHGHEVDLLRQRGAKVDAIEIKASATVSSALMRGLGLWAKQAGELVGEQYLVIGGEASGTRQGVTLLGWRDLGRIHDP